MSEEMPVVRMPMSALTEWLERTGGRVMREEREQGAPGWFIESLPQEILDALDYSLLPLLYRHYAAVLAERDILSKENVEVFEIVKAVKGLGRLQFIRQELPVLLEMARECEYGGGLAKYQHSIDEIIIKAAKDQIVDANKMVKEGR